MTLSLAAIAVAAAAIFVAEFGDKSQLLMLAFATRYRAAPVIAGLVIAAAAIQAVSVAIGAAVGAVLPTTAVAVAAGLAFVVVGLWTLRGEDGEAEDGAATAPSIGRRLRLGVVATVAAAFMLGELGDKTMLVTFGLAASQDPLSTWIGATAGEVAANLVAVAVGRQVGQRLDAALVRRVSAALFIAGGVVVAGGALVVGD